MIKEDFELKTVAIALIRDTHQSIDNNRVAKRDLGFAKKVASRACELTKYKNPAILDTLARVYFEKGDIESAIKYQTMAVEHAGDDRMGEGIREALKKYEAARGG